MSTHLAFYLGLIVGGSVMSVFVLFVLALQEKFYSRKLVKEAERGVDIVLPTGRKSRLLLAPEAAQ
jgi:hypothetical protein